MEDFRRLLIERAIVSAEQLEPEGNKGAISAEPLYYQLLRKYPEKERDIWVALADFLQIELLDPHEVKLDASLARLIPARLAHQFSIVPLKLSGQKLEVAMADPRQFEQCDELALLLNQTQKQNSEYSHQQKQGKNNKIQSRNGWSQGKDNRYHTGSYTDNISAISDSLVLIGRLAMPSDIADMIKELYGIGAETVQDMIEQQGQGEDITILTPEVVELTAQDELSEDAAIIRFVNQLLLEAVKIKASDIHLEPFEKELRIRYRIDGMLQTEPVPKNVKHLEAAVISRIKIMAHMDIAEKRLPQDGQIRLAVMGRPIDVRVSVLPTMFGQGLALRLLDRQVMFRNLNNLGMPEDYLELYRQVLTLSHGVVLVTGPTGSGKTTTLYASLNEINRTVYKIITVEDPIEYQLEGVSQVQVRPAIGLNFATMLRSILRHDPDIIMVGEIRDRETAQIAISAAMTGHLVFSTLHTNDASSAPVRLLEMGVEPYLVSSSLEAVIAQRLIRLLCPRCKTLVKKSNLLPWQDMEALSTDNVYKSKGCPFCRQSGYKGRTAIFEMFTLNNRMRELIINRSNAMQIRQEAISMGMRTLHQSGLEKVNQGLTSLAEIYRVARDETIDMKQHLQDLRNQDA